MTAEWNIHGKRVYARIPRQKNWGSVMVRLKKGILSSVAAFLVAVGGAAAANAASGAWSNQGTGTTMYQTNWYYWGTVINPVGSVPATATISSLSWSVSTSSSPTYNSGKRYRICHNTKTGTCYNYTPAAATTYDFNGYAANKPFQIATFVNWSTTVIMTPTITVGTEQILVNYSY